MTQKYEIREKEYFYEKNGNPFSGIKYSVWNIRSGRKMGQHKTREEAENQLDQLNTKKTAKGHYKNYAR